jgi:glycosyltransferase involved in cell wall biosynthesis
MKILHINTSDINGGAARAMFRLHKGLLNRGIESRLFSKEKQSDDSNIITLKKPIKWQKLAFKWRKEYIKRSLKAYSKPAGFEKFSTDLSPYRGLIARQLPEADIYHLHWTSDFVDLPALIQSIHKPIIWTLHDMWPFTGGCHYSSGCNRYEDKCGTCPQLGSKLPYDLSYQVWNRKHLVLRKKDKEKFLACADSQWLCEKALNSSLLGDFKVTTVHYGLETDEFLPRDKEACRKALNIPSDKVVLVFGAPGIDNPRKGFQYLMNAISVLTKRYPDLYLVSFGGGIKPADINIPWLHLGHIADNHLLSIVYNTGDLFVIPSVEEAFGQTCLEAMSCGVPAIGFSGSGGITDMIIDNKTGVLAHEMNADSLSQAIEKGLSLSTDDYNIMSANCRQMALSEYTLDIQAQRYISIYESIQK